MGIRSVRRDGEAKVVAHYAEEALTGGHPDFEGCSACKVARLDILAGVSVGTRALPLVPSRPSRAVPV